MSETENKENGKKPEEVSYVIKYPSIGKDKNDLSNIQMKTLRYIRKNGIKFQKMTGIIFLKKDENWRTLELEDLGADLIPINPLNQTNGTEKPISFIVTKFGILNRVFKKAITENKAEIIEFLLENITSEELKLLQEEEK